MLDQPFAFLTVTLANLTILQARTHDDVLIIERSIGLSANRIAYAVCCFPLRYSRSFWLSSWHLITKHPVGCLAFDAHANRASDCRSALGFRLEHTDCSWLQELMSDATRCEFACHPLRSTVVRHQRWPT